MIVLDDPANPFSLIFSIRKIPNDLLDLERLNRPGESVPSRESRTATLYGLFLLEGPAAALCKGTQITQIANATRKNLVVKATPGKNRQHLNQHKWNYNAKPAFTAELFRKADVGAGAVAIRIRA